MDKKRIFISSVQKEFAQERRQLCSYISKDALFVGRNTKYNHKEHKVFRKEHKVASFVVNFVFFVVKSAFGRNIETLNENSLTLKANLESSSANLETSKPNLETSKSKTQDYIITLRDDFEALKPLQLPKRLTRTELEKVILEICKNEYLTLGQISRLVGRSSAYLMDEIIPILVDSQKLVRLYPAKPNHQNQAYKTNNNYER